MEKISLVMVYSVSHLRRQSKLFLEIRRGLVAKHKKHYKERKRVFDPPRSGRLRSALDLSRVRLLTALVIQLAAVLS